MIKNDDEYCDYVEKQARIHLANCAWYDMTLKIGKMSTAFLELGEAIWRWGHWK